MWKNKKRRALAVVFSGSVFNVCWLKWSSGKVQPPPHSPEVLCLGVTPLVAGGSKTPKCVSFTMDTGSHVPLNPGPGQGGTPGQTPPPRWPGHGASPCAGQASWARGLCQAELSDFFFLMSNDPLCWLSASLPSRLFHSLRGTPTVGCILVSDFRGAGRPGVLPCKGGDVEKLPAAFCGRNPTEGSVVCIQT